MGIPFFFREAPDFLLLRSHFLSSYWEFATSSEHAGVISLLNSLYKWGQGQVSSQNCPERRGPVPTMPCGVRTLTSLPACPYLLLPPTPPIQDQRHCGGQQPICEDTWLSTGGEISFTSAPVIWTVSNEAIFVTSTDE